MIYICKIYNIISYLNYSLKYLCAYICNPSHFIHVYKHTIRNSTYFLNIQINFIYLDMISNNNNYYKALKYK